MKDKFFRKIIELIFIISFSCTHLDAKTKDYDTNTIKKMNKSELTKLLKTGSYKTKYNILKFGLNKFRKNNSMGRPGKFVETELTADLKNVMIDQLQIEIEYWENKEYTDRDTEYRWEAYQELLSTVAWLKDDSTITLLVNSLNTPCGLKIVEDTLVEFRAEAKQLLIIKFNSEDTKWKHRISSVLYKIMQAEKGANINEK